MYWPPACGPRRLQIDKIDVGSSSSTACAHLLNFRPFSPAEFPGASLIRRANAAAEFREDWRLSGS